MVTKNTACDIHKFVYNYLHINSRGRVVLYISNSSGSDMKAVYITSAPLFFRMYYYYPCSMSVTKAASWLFVTIAPCLVEHVFSLSWLLLQPFDPLWLVSNLLLAERHYLVASSSPFLTLKFLK